MLWWICSKIYIERQTCKYYHKFNMVPSDSFMSHLATQLGYSAGEFPLQWLRNGRDSVSNHQPYDCLLNRLFRCRSKKTSKLCVTGLWAGNSPTAGEFPAQMASNAEKVSIWWRHHAGFATDCPCDVWCRGLTTCLLHVGPPFGNRFLNTSWAVGLTYWIVYLHFFLYFGMCNYICLDTSYHFLALSLLLKYS